MVGGGAIPWAGVRSSIRKQVEQAMRSQPVSSSSPQLLHQLRIQVSALLEFLS